MRLPLKQLVRYTGNMYELVSAAIKRAQQITDIRAAFNPTTLEGQETGQAIIEQEQDFGDEKASVVAYKEILEGDVVYKTREE